MIYAGVLAMLLGYRIVAALRKRRPEAFLPCKSSRIRSRGRVEIAGARPVDVSYTGFWSRERL
jgi:hypothetical protein